MAGAMGRSSSFRQFHPRLVEAVAARLRTPPAKAVVRRFADMEIFVEILENVRALTFSLSSRPLIRPMIT